MRSMNKPEVLDLFAGVGGAGRGYARAGFSVHGVDHVAQPDNPYSFRLMDALEYAYVYAAQIRDTVDLIHASPPCQRKCTLTAGTNAHLAEKYPDLYPQTKALLEEIGLPYVIENPSSRPDVVLCGEMFGLRVIRHRKFELGGWETEAPKHINHRGRVAGMRHGVWYEGPYFAVYGEGGGKGSVAQWQHAMGIHWTDNRKSIAEAIPPAYTEYIGRQFLAQKENRNG